jgi:hypothetical protein
MAPEQTQAAAVVALQLRRSYAAELARQPVVVAEAPELPVSLAAVVAVATLEGEPVVKYQKYLERSNLLDQCCAAERPSLDNFQ